MPLHEEHCQDSLRRYGKRFDELHRWMDEPSTIMGSSHRKVRHDPYKTPKEALKLFGEFADQACLDHIRLDALESRGKGVKRTIREPQPLDIIMSGFMSVMLFIVGLVIVFTSPPYASYAMLFSIPFFIFSFILFLAFIGLLAKAENHKN